MPYENAFIPYGAYWSTPFCKWQGSYADLHPIKFAAGVTVQALEERELEASEFDALYLGTTVPSRSSFYGAPWLAGLIGAEEITGPTISQACATSARVIGSAAYEVEANAANGSTPALLCVTADRTSNGPHMVYPNPLAPGAKPEIEDWVWDNFNEDPFACNAMIETAENVARERGIETQAQHEVVLMRHAQYEAALADDSAFHRSFMVSPVEVNPTGRKVLAEVTTDEGIYPTTAEALGKLKPVLPDGTVTFGGQTYPADGNAGMVVTGRERAAKMSRNPSIQIRLLAFGQGRARRGFMPEANLPAVNRALDIAGIEVADLAAIKTHNPFAVNDICLSDSFGIPLEKMNNYGSSLIWGHPQGPTGMRLVIELIEELVRLGGGYGLFTGCAAGDTAGALVLEVSEAN
ncbi:MAG: thiolase family protein [Anaerolineales bacterium]